MNEGDQRWVFDQFEAYLRSYLPEQKRLASEDEVINDYSDRHMPVEESAPTVETSGQIDG